MEKFTVTAALVIIAGLGSLVVQYQSVTANSHIPGNPRFQTHQANSECYERERSQWETGRQYGLAKIQYTLEPHRHFARGLMGPQSESETLYHSQSFEIETCWDSILVHLNVCQCAPYGSISGGRITLKKGPNHWTVDFYHLGGEGSLWMESPLPQWARSLSESVDRETISDEFLMILEECYQAEHLDRKDLLEIQTCVLTRKLIGAVALMEAGATDSSVESKGP